MDPCILFVSLNGIPTKLVIFDDNNASNDLIDGRKFSENRLILMISGNPGEIEYYNQYLYELYQKTRLPIIGISNSGHNRIDNHLMKPNLKNNDELFGLEAQILHKAKFIQDFILPTTKLILVAHSIGCYVVLELLNRFENISQMIDHCILLNPTIDSMIATKSGTKLNFIFQYFYYPIIGLAHCIEFLLSQQIRENMMAAFFRFNGYKNLPQNVIKSATNLLNPYCLKATICMVLDEFGQIFEPKWNIIENNAKRLSLYYSENDHWVPIEYYYKIRNKLEKFLNLLDLRLCLENIEHAFIMQPENIGKIVKLTIEAIQTKWQL